MLIHNNHLCEDDLINTFLSILSHSYQPKYPDSIIHPLVVYLNFSDLDGEICSPNEK